MYPVCNLFAPGAGIRPPELSGRVGLLKETRVAIGRAKLRRPAKLVIVVGLRGVGKTVLLNEFDQLEESFFRVRFDRLAPREKNSIRAMARLSARIRIGPAI